MTGLVRRGRDLRRRLVLGFVGLCLAAPAAAEYRAPRTAYGVPDFDGAWTNNSLTKLQRPDEFKALVVSDAEAAAFEKIRRGKPPEIKDDVGGADSEWWDTDVGLARIRGGVRTSWIVAPADGQIPLTVAAKAANQALTDRRKVDFDHPEIRDLGERCLGTEAAGPPLRNGGQSDNFKIVQTPDQIAILAEYGGNVRIVRLGQARHPPASVRLRMGDSIGRWEGETLVVETTNFSPVEVRASDGDTGADMRVVERFTRTSPTEFLYAFEVRNPARFAQSWQGEMAFRTLAAPIFEYACHEGNYSLPGILSGARQQEAAAAKAKP